MSAIKFILAFTQIVFDNRAHSGMIKVDVDNDVIIYECKDWNVEGTCKSLPKLMHPQLMFYDANKLNAHMCNLLHSQQRAGLYCSGILVTLACSKIKLGS